MRSDRYLNQTMRKNSEMIMSLDYTIKNLKRKMEKMTKQILEANRLMDNKIKENESLQLELEKNQKKTEL